MELNNLRPAKGATHSTKRIGRGEGSGRGGTSTKGHKGAQSRRGYSSKAGFEGGQMPLKLRVPKFGFKNLFRVEFQPINIDAIQEIAETFNLSVIKPADMKDHGLISSIKKPVKILGRGEVTSKLEVHANAFSETAKAAIESVGGTTVNI